MKIAYDRRYNFPFSGWASRQHPFDGRKYGRAWQRLRELVGTQIDSIRLAVPRAISDEELLLVHDPAYLQRLKRADVVARVVEVPQLAKVPGWLLDRLLLAPMRWATAGTIITARAAIAEGLAVNLGGGFHHAKPAAGEGFCCYADVAIAAAVLRREGRLGPDDRIAYVDLDAHLGNGVATCFHDDRRLFHFDLFHDGIYPAFDVAARERVDCLLPISGNATGAEYLRTLRNRLPGFLDSVGRANPIRLAVYNAGTDVFVDDELGGLNCTAEDVLERDRFVVDELRSRRIPTLVVTSGGYSPRSYELIADSIAAWYHAGY